MTRVVVRAFASGRLLFEEEIDADAVDIGTLAEAHALKLVEAGEPHMLELEFLDEPDPFQRFFRIGTDKSGMVLPIAIDLSDLE